MNWDECINSGFVKEKSPRIEQAESLLRASEKKFISHEQLKINDDTASSKVGLLYDSVRIMLEALSIRKGYKIYNHECITCFLKEVMHEKELSEKFDKYRIIRNGLNYYGDDILVDDAKIMIQEMSDMRLQIIKKYFEETK